MKSRGFTLVEIIVVIVIIAILAAISIVSYNGIQTRAKATAVLDTLVKMEKALRINASLDMRDEWWDDEDWTSYSGKPPMTVVITETSFGDDFKQVPDGYNLPDPGDWTYDNDMDVYDGCNTNSRGVNVYIFNYNDTASAQIIDDEADDGDLSCGKLRMNDEGRLLWNIDRDFRISN